MGKNKERRAGHKKATVMEISKGIKRKSTKKSKCGTSTRETVIRLEERVDWIVDKLKRHCERHWYVEGAVITAAIGYLIKLVFTLRI